GVSFDTHQTGLMPYPIVYFFFFFFQAEDGIRDFHVTGVQTCALPISSLTPSPTMATLDSARRRLIASTLSSGIRSPQASVRPTRSEEHTSELQSRENLVCRLLLEKKKRSKKLKVTYRCRNKAS